MKIARADNSTKNTLLILGAILVLGIATLVVLERTRVTDFVKTTPASSTGPTREEQETQKAIEQDKKQEFIESPDPTQSEPSALGLELTAKQETDGSVTVLSKIQNAASGKCNLTITNGSATHTQSADIIYQPDFSSCAGFSVPKEKLGVGEWTIKLSVTTTETLEKVTTLKVN